MPFQRMPVLLSVALFLAVPVSAFADAPSDGAPRDEFAVPASDVVSTAEDRCAPPCGYINPLIDMDFPEKPPCGGGVAVREGRPTDCLPVPAEGEPIVLEGTVRWYWQVSEEGTYPDDPATDIVLSFGGTASNPGFLDVTVEPSEFVITSVDLLSPQYLRPVEDDAGTQVWYWYEQPITATITRSGEPTPAEVDRLEDRDGIQGLFLKAKSNGSSDRFKEAFGVEEFRFDAGPQVEDAEAPGFPVVLLLAALGALALARRR